MNIRYPLTLLFVFLCTLSSCNQTAYKQTSNITLKKAQMQNQETVYIVLSQNQIQPVSNGKPVTFYLEGSLNAGKFVLKSKEIEGEGLLATEGRKGWFEINSRKFYPQETPRSVTSPYVKGHMTSNGFVPSSKMVF